MEIKKIKIKGYKEEEITLYILANKDIAHKKSPALIFMHGGGFIFEASKSHYILAKKYAKECNCKVIYIKYNLAPKYPFPYPQYECYKAYQYVFNNHEELNIDINNVGITGDSAGASLAVVSMLLGHIDKKPYLPKFQLLIYPWLDNRGTSLSNQKYVDTPMWNSSLSKKSHKYTNKDNIVFPYEIISPVQYEDLSFLPEAYIEAAEFDCLHDDAFLYATLLKENNIKASLFEVKGTMHGYDTKYKAQTVRKMFIQRINYIKDKFLNN